MTLIFIYDNIAGVLFCNITLLHLLLTKAFTSLRFCKTSAVSCARSLKESELSFNYSLAPVV